MGENPTNDKEIPYRSYCCTRLVSLSALKPDFEVRDVKPASYFEAGFTYSLRRIAIYARAAASWMRVWRSLSEKAFAT
jgi:hypothetical protein